MNRHRQHEKLSHKVRGELPRVAVQWLAAARRPLERLTRAALDPEISEAEFVELVALVADSLPGLLDEMDHDALAGLMEGAMGAGMANGLSARVSPAKSQ